jgi:putative ABC transport system permease protein
LKFDEAVTLSFSNVRKHRLGSFLTALGMAVGVAVVVALMTLGASFQAYFIQQYNSEFAANAFSIGPQATSSDQVVATSGTVLYFFATTMFSTYDVKAVGNLPGVLDVAPYAEAGGSGGIKVDGQAIQTSFQVPVTETTAAIFNQGFLKLGSGNLSNGSGQAVVGHSLALVMSIELGASNQTSYVLGKQLTLRVGGVVENTTIVGVLAEDPTGSNVNTGVYVPFKAISENSSAPVYNGMLVFAQQSANMAKVQASVLGYLNSGSDAQTQLRSTGQGLSFVALSLPGASTFLQQQIGEYSTIILAMGLVALFGGAVGMSNTMLVSVTERTKEIGTLKAIGGSRRDVLRVFLLEALFISFIGVAMGLLGGAALGYWLTTFKIFGINLPLVYNVAWFFIAGGMGILTGLLAGVYPAWKAARLQPVVALRTG